MFRKMGPYLLCVLIGVALGQEGVREFVTRIATAGPGTIGQSIVEPLKTMWDNSGDLGLFE